MTRALAVSPIAAAAFAPFGTVLAAGPEGAALNGGTARRVDQPDALDLTRADGRPLLSLIRARPVGRPVGVALLERHRLSSQTFACLSGHTLLAVVAPPGDAVDPVAVRAFLVPPGVGLTYAPGTWHAPLMALDGPADVLVIGRGTPVTDCDFAPLDPPFRLVLPSTDRTPAMPTLRPRDALVDLYYEDVIEGEVVETDAHTVTMDDIHAFADVTRDHHPLHVDPDYCSRTRFGRPIAHGLFGLSLIEGLKTELKLYENTSVASLGWDKVRFRAPIFPGDTLHVRMLFREKRPSRSGPNGIVVEEIELLNQAGVAVITAEHASLLIRRPEAE